MYDVIAKTIAAVIATKKDIVDFARRNSGGYEGWLQVETAKKFNEIGATVSREEPYANNPQYHCDLCVNGVYIELKTESDGYNGYAGYGAPNDLADDVCKLAQLLNHGSVGYAVRVSKDRANLPALSNGVVRGVAVYHVNDFNGTMNQMNNYDWAATYRGQSGRGTGRYFITVVEVGA